MFLIFNHFSAVLLPIFNYIKKYNDCHIKREGVMICELLKKSIFYYDGMKRARQVKKFRCL